MGTAAKKNAGTEAALAVPLAAVERILGLTVGRARDLHNRLSVREHQVADRIAEGMSNEEIANDLHINTLTVNTHRSNVKHRLEAATTVAVANVINLIRLADAAVPRG